MSVPFQWPLAVGIAGTVAGLLTAALSLGLSRLPVWRHGRVYALVAVTAAGYSACDLVMLTSWPAGVVAFGVQLACLFAMAHAAAWLAYLAAFEGRGFSRADHVLFAGGALVGLIGLVPGTLVTQHIVVIDVAWIGATYRTPEPTVAGMVAYGYFAALMIVVAVRTARRRTAAGGPLLGGLAALGVAAVSDTLVSAGWLPLPLLLDAVSAGVVVAAAVINQRRVAADLAETQQALARSERVASISRLAAGIAHEINNPLAILRHDLGQMAAGGRELPRYAAHAMAAVDRIARVVRQFSDLGLATRPGTAAVAVVSIPDAVGRAVDAARVRLASAAVSVEVPAGLVALGDPARLADVLGALLQNAAYAVAARRPGSGEGRVGIMAAERGDRVEIEIADNGGGLPPQVRQRLFEPFVNTHPFGQGAGLGLAVAYGLMRSQGGSLQLVESTSRGTTFRIELPRATSTGADAPPAPRPPRDDLRPIGVLIIDDDPDLLAVLGDAAEAYRFRPTLVSSVADGLAAVRRGAEIDVVLCDLMMPDGGAITWFRLAERDHPELAARTLVITGGPSSAESLAFADAHPDRILYKPFAMADVRQAAWRVLQGG